MSLSEALSFSLCRLGLPHVTLKEEQRIAIEAVHQGRDVFVCLPTGFGKSLCYQTLPFVADYFKRKANGAVLVVSPHCFDRRPSWRFEEAWGASIHCHFIHLCGKKNMCTDQSLATDRLFYCAPEALVTSRWRCAFDKPGFSNRIMAVVVDEAHCVSKW